MDQKKVCPLRVLASETGSAGWGPVNRDATACIGPACAWYDATTGCCALLTLARRA